MERLELRPRNREEIIAWLTAAKQRKQEWTNRMQERMAEIDRSREESMARFNAFCDKYGYE